jgi:metallophosphoesterase (TIGR00282 family)
MVQKHLHALREKYAINAVIVNGENSADGRGITPKLMHFFKHVGVNVVTSGNHIWHHKDIYEYLQYNTDLLRPENFPTECPGTGVTTFNVSGITVGVINVQGRVFMREHLACPFKTVESVLTFLQTKAKIILVDFHAETTAEKMAMGFFLDGKVSAVVGTHTHVQTADERILPQGTAFITDLGMAGSLNSMIGMKKDPIIRNFITQMPARFVVETEKPYFMCGVVIEIDATSGKALKISRIRIDDSELVV